MPTYWRWKLASAALVATLTACSSSDGDGSGGATHDAGGATASGGSGASAGGGGSGGAPVDCDAKAEGCASSFGSLFSNSNGRADGTLVAVVRPQDTQCTLFNDDHVVVQLSIAGQVQRLVIAIEGVAVTTVSAPMVGPAFSEGWHPDTLLDYMDDLGATSTDFTSVSFDEAVSFICSSMAVGAPISVFAYSDDDNSSSAHQIHRNDNYPDGAIVVAPTSASPQYLLFRYDDQVF